MTSGDEISELDIVSQWCAAGEQGDAGKAARCLAPGVELISPLTEQFRFVGREQVRELLHAAFVVIDDIQFHTRGGDWGDAGCVLPSSPRSAGARRGAVAAPRLRRPDP